MTYTSYETSKRLKEFLGDSAPEPIGLRYIDEGGYKRCVPTFGRTYHCYTLEDLLSKPFCETIGKLASGKEFESYTEGNQGYTNAKAVHLIIANAYYFGGMEAVEKALLEMMDGK